MPLAWRQMVMDIGSSCQVPRDQWLIGRLVGGLSHLSNPVCGETSADGGGTAVEAKCHAEVEQAQGIASVSYIVQSWPALLSHRWRSSSL